MDLVEKKQEKIQLFENRKRKLEEVNEQFNLESAEIPLNQDYPGIRTSLVKFQNEDRYCKPENVIACHLRDSEEKPNEDLGQNSKLNKSKHVTSVAEIENMPADEQDENQTFPALLEPDNLEENSVICSKLSKYFNDLWGFVKYFATQEEENVHQDIVKVEDELKETLQTSAFDSEILELERNFKSFTDVELHRHILLAFKMVLNWTISLRGSLQN
uniref:Uncharacterized protein n=1 Tax=Sphaerodactylus townsendi TaxID=933632 RepID=A0ACB8G374_9SAUR